MDVSIEKSMEQSPINGQSARNNIGNLLGNSYGFDKINTVRKTQTALRTCELISNITFEKGESIPDRLTSPYSSNRNDHVTYEDDTLEIGLGKSKIIKTLWKERL